MSSNIVGISKRDILIFLFKWKGTVFGWALFTVILVTALTYLIPQPYPATAKVVVERNRAPTLRSTLTNDGLESIEAMNNEIAIISSRPVMSAVVDELAPHERPSRDSLIRSMTQALKGGLATIGLISDLTPREDWIDRLLRVVEIDPVINSNVLEISYSDEEPEWSAKIVNMITSQYIRRHLAVYSSQGVTDFYSEQVQAAASELERLRQEALDYKKSGSISAVTDRRSQLVRELTTARVDMGRARSARAELLTRYEAGHTEVQLEDERIASLEATERSIQQQLETLEQQESEIEALDMQTRTQEATFLELQRGYERARLNAASNAEIINVRLVEYAEIPVKPRFARLLLIFLSIPLGFTLSTSIAFLRAYMDHRADDPDTAESALGVPCLGSIPSFDPPKTARTWLKSRRGFERR